MNRVARSPRQSRFLFGSCCLMVATIVVVHPLVSAQAQITPDATLGSGPSSLTPNVTIKGQPALQIDGGVTRGSNLFHSFSQFNVGNLQRVYFANPAGIQAIITRVTGASPSNILGTLGVNGSASLFLINPNGIFFGPNARLDIAGSFVATTANRLQFPDGSEFSATNPQAPPLLTINITPGVQFGASSPTAAIVNQGRLTSGQDLVLVGGTLQLQGQLQAGRDLTLRATRSLQAQNATLTVTSSGPKLGSMTLDSPGTVLVDNTRITTTTGPSNSQGGGDVLIRANSLSVINQSLLSTSTTGSGAGGNMTLEVPAGKVTISNSNLSTTTRSSGRGGVLSITTNQLETQNRSSLRVTTSGQGPGGDLNISAAQSVFLSQSLLAVETQGSGTGLAGFLQISTPTLVLDGTKVSTTVAPTTTGRGGSIFVNANTINISGRFPFPSVDTTSGIFAGTFSDAPAGNINFQPLPGAPTLAINFLDKNGGISASGGQGPGGNITLSAPESVTVTGAGNITVATRGTQRAGNLIIKTGTLSVDGSIFEATTFGQGDGGKILVFGNSLFLTNGTKFVTNTSGAGAAGNIELQLTDRLVMTGTGTGLFAGTGSNSTGKSGNIVIDPQQILIQDGAGIAVNSLGRGLGGNVAIQAGNLTLDRNAFISAETSNSDGGNITLQISQILLLRHNSRITATAGGIGNGGNIQIATTFVVANLFENSDITANAVFGNGGKLTINSQAILGLQFSRQLTPFSDISASSQFGLDGQVDLNVPKVDPQRGLVTLPVDLVDATQQIVQGCQPNRSAQVGQFTLAGRGGLPDTPSAPLSSEAFWQDLQLYGLTAQSEGLTPSPTPVANLPAPVRASCTNPKLSAIHPEHQP